jgi:undecaprenyl-diphosphatase
MTAPKFATTYQPFPSMPAAPWLTPLRCRWALAAIITTGFFAHLFYLTHNCPIDLSGDEAQYWDWSRALGLSYYSKGPLIAYIIRASCALFGDNMPAVRLPALLLGAGTSIVTYLLTARLFHSERLALGAVLLNHLVPLFIAGSLLMTIDAPLFFCWGLATCLAAIALFENKKWPWPLIGLIVGIGALGKYAMLLWLPIAGVAMLLDEQGRRILRTPAPWLACAFALVCLTPVVIWNARHDWVTLRHVAHQTGAAGGALSHGDLLSLIGSQIGVVGPTLAVLMGAAILEVWRNRRTDRRGVFLTVIGLGFLAFNLLASLFAKAQVNWPAPTYFTLTILTARFLAIRMESPAAWRPWRPWFYATILLGLIFMPIAHDAVNVIPLVRHFTKDPHDADLLARLRGWHTLGNVVTDKLAALPPGAFVMCDDYQQTAEMAFYVHGQPKTYCAGPYFGKRLSQYDMWPDRRLDRSSPLVGHDAVYIGKGGDFPDEITAAFASIEPRQDLDITVHGVKIQDFKIYLCHGFKGFNAIAHSSSSESF